MFSNPFRHYFWCLPEGSEPPSQVQQRPDFQIHYGVPDGSKLPRDSFVVLDDLQHAQDVNTQLLHTVHSHHRNLTVLTLNHSIFPKNRFQRDLTQSVKYYLIAKNPRDTQAFFRFALQLDPTRARSLYSSYLDSCCEPFGYLLCDLTQRAHPALKYLSNILPSDEGLTIYATDQDVARLMREDPRYVRYSEALHSPCASPVEEQQETEESHFGVSE